MKLYIYQDWPKFLYMIRNYHIQLECIVSLIFSHSLSPSLSLRHTYTRTRTHTNTHQAAVLTPLCQSVDWLLTDRSLWVPRNSWLILLFHWPHHVVKGKMANYEKRIAPGKGIRAKGSCFPSLSGHPGAITAFPVCRALEKFTDLGQGDTFSFQTVFLYPL